MAKPEIHPEVFVAAGAVVVGDVRIDAESSVWFQAVLRGDADKIRVGKRTNIQDGCVLHADPGCPCTLGDGVSLGHGAIVHGATVGDNALIGMRAVVMNRCVIGADSIVGVGSVVTEGTQVPPRSLVLGLPGKVVRTLTDDEVARNRRTADVYAARSAEYRRNGGQPAD